MSDNHIETVLKAVIIGCVGVCFFMILAMIVTFPFWVELEAFCARHGYPASQIKGMTEYCTRTVDQTQYIVPRSAVQ